MLCILLAQQTLDPRYYGSTLFECAHVRCVQAVKQTMSTLTNRLASVAEQVTKLQQRCPAASHGSQDSADDSADDSAFKQRLRKIELTVAGKSWGLLQYF